jgi:2-phosphosulfolactate phosphatase
MHALRVHFLPQSLDPSKFDGNLELLFDGDIPVGRIRHPENTCVVIDVLRATTTIVYALAADARAVIPCLTIDDAHAAASKVLSGTAILAGERGGLMIPGFHLGNSPAEFVREKVAERIVVLTTTNGTRAVAQARQAGTVLFGAFVNLSAICKQLDQDTGEVDLICAGTDGHVTREDVLLAGAIVDRLCARDHWRPNDEALIARAAWQQIAGRLSGSNLQLRLVEALRASRGGRNLIALGMGADIELAAEIDRFDLVPRFDSDRGRIVRG